MIPFQDGRAVMHHGDSRDVLRTLADASIDSVVCDPPYGIAFMGRAWDSRDGAAFAVEFWAEVLRVLKPGGHVVAFSGTRTYHRLAIAIEDAGFNIRDQLAWVYGQGFPKSHNLSGEWKGWGTALKPAWEPIVLARKPLAEGTVAANVLAHGTGAINVDACRVKGAPWKAVTTTGLGSVKFFSEGATATIKKAPHDLGRFPANLVHDGSPEVLAGFPQTTSGSIKPHHIRTTSKTKNTFGERAAPPEQTFGDSGSAARFFYCAKASKTDRAGSKHPTVKPVDLMRWLVRLVTKPGGTVLEPFAGSGTTLQACLEEGVRVIGVEREAEFFGDCCRRLEGLDPSHRQVA